MTPLRLGLLMDPLEEGWHSMDVAGDELLGGLARTPEAVTVHPLRPRIPRLARRLADLGTKAAPGPNPALDPRVTLDPRLALNVDRTLARHVFYPALSLARAARGGLDAFHIVDHSYAQLAHALPAARTGVYCHDLDTFRSLLQPTLEPRPAWYRALARHTLRGMQRAALVFYSTRAVRSELLEHRVVPAERLVHAPLGVSEEFSPHDDGRGAASGDLQHSLADRPYLLHVGGPLRRKRLDVLLRVFAGARQRHPGLCLVQLGARDSREFRDEARALGVDAGLVLPGSLPRAALARLYRGARLVLITSESEGFGLPVIEALASGAEVVASDLPVLREVGADAVHFAPMGEVGAWVERVCGLLSGSLPPIDRAVRLARAERFRWQTHAATVLAAYRELDASAAGGAGRSARDTVSAASSASSTVRGA
jgi:glycosyltransferase involved in cell wall biosynthesis